MDGTLSWIAGGGSVDAVERALSEVDAAITMVASGFARSVRLCNLPAADEAAFDAAARAQAAAVAFNLQRDGTRSVTMIIGPRLGDGSPLERWPVDHARPDDETPA